MRNRLSLAAVWLINLKKRGDNVHISAYSAKSAFYILLSAVPVITLAMGITTVFFPLDKMLENGIATLFSADIKNIAISAMAKIAQTNGTSVISVSTVIMVWSATKGIRSVAQGIRVIYGTKRKGIVAEVVRSVVYTGFMAFALGLSFVVLVMASPLERLITIFLGNEGGIIIAVINMRNIIFFLLLWILFSFAYSFLGQSGIPFKGQLFGGALASAGWIVASYGYSVYIKYFSRYPAIYGGFGAVMLFMMWLYICINILLWGALINRIKWKKDHEL